MNNLLLLFSLFASIISNSRNEPYCIQSSVRDFVITPSTRNVFYTDQSGIYFYNLEERKTELLFEAMGLNRLAITTDSTYLYFSNAPGEVYEYNLLNHNQQKIGDFEEITVFKVVKNKYLAVGTKNGLIQLFEGEKRIISKKENDVIAGIHFHEGSQSLLITLFNGEIIFAGLENDGTKEFSLPGKPVFESTIDNSDGKIQIAQKNRLLTYRYSNGNFQQISNSRFEDWVSSVDVNEHQKVLLVALTNGKIFVRGKVGYKSRLNETIVKTKFAYENSILVKLCVLTLDGDLLLLENDDFKLDM